MRKCFCLLLCLVILGSFLVLQVSADFEVTYYNESVYAGGILNMRAFVGESNLSGYSFQWQFQGVGEGSWVNLEDNASYKGTKTEHLQVHTTYGEDYTQWKQIPFRCKVTKNGVTKTTPNLYMEIYPSDGLEKALKNWDFGLYEPHVDNAISLTTGDYSVYTAKAYAGTKLRIYCGGNTETQKTVLTNSEVVLRREIRITENGKYVTTGDDTTYVPYTIGQNAVQIQINMRIIMAGVDRGIYQTKTVNLSTQKPKITGTGTAKSNCSLLRYTYNESEKLASIPKGTALEIAGTEGSYYRVVYNNRVGYVPTSALNVQAVNNGPVIDDVEITIQAPAAGQTPATTCNILTAGCELYKTEPITWTDKTTGKIVKSNEKFIEGHSYTLSVWLAAKNGYRFQTDDSGNPKLTGAINGSLPPFIYKAYEQDPEKVIELTYDFNNVKAHSHTYTEWQYNFGQHYKHCTGCDEVFFLEGHKGGIATCTEKAKCSVCGYAYGPEPDHKWSPKYHPVDASGHAWQCADCKGYDTVKPHNPGPAATDTTPQTCTDCGYIITPAKNHKHKLTKVAMVEPTCTKEGRIEYYTCDGCAKLFEDKDGKKEIPESRNLSLPTTAHIVSDDWKYDESCHWRTCTECKGLLEETQMVHEMREGKCTTCGYTEGAPIPEITEPDATDTPAGEETLETLPQNPANESENSWLWLIVVAVVSLGGGALAAVLIHLKKKRSV